MASRARGLPGRLAQAGATVLTASVLIWALLPLAPGDPAMFVLTARGERDPLPAQVAEVRSELGLDDPWAVQYGRWVAGVARGDLGDEYGTGAPVASGLAARLPPTLRLVTATLALATATTLVAGLAAAAFPGRWPDQLVRLGSATCASVPSFVLGVVLLQVVVVRLGRGSVIAGAGWGDAWLPAACLGVPTAARWAQILRVGLLEALGSGYHLVAAARGARRLRLMIVHALPNALLPLLTAIGLGGAYLLAGTAVVESIFSWPGIGLHLLHAVRDRDLPVIQAVAVLSTVGFVATSLLVDMVARLVDPRLRAARW